MKYLQKKTIVETHELIVIKYNWTIALDNKFTTNLLVIPT